MSSRYKVVINHEEQYSIWPVDRELGKGWKEVGIKGDGSKCLNYIEEVWTDMRPAQKTELQKIIQRG